MQTEPEPVLLQIDQTIRKTRSRVILCTCAVSLAVALNAGLLADAYLTDVTTIQAVLRTIGAGAAALAVWYCVRAWKSYLKAKGNYSRMQAAQESIESPRDNPDAEQKIPD